MGSHKGLNMSSRANLCIVVVLCSLAGAHACGSFGGACYDGYSCHSPNAGEYCPNGDYECCFSNEDDVQAAGYTAYYIVAGAAFFVCLCGSCVYRRHRMRRAMDSCNVSTAPSMVYDWSTSADSSAVYVAAPAPDAPPVYSQTLPVTKHPPPPPPSNSAYTSPQGEWLPPGWKSFKDATSGKVYYQRADGSVTWDLGPGPDGASQSLLA